MVAENEEYFPRRVLFFAQPFAVDLVTGAFLRAGRESL
jgi:hypothetical protein